MSTSKHSFQKGSKKASDAGRKGGLVKSPKNRVNEFLASASTEQAVLEYIDKCISGGGELKKAMLDKLVDAQLDERKLQLKHEIDLLKMDAKHEKDLIKLEIKQADKVLLVDDQLDKKQVLMSFKSLTDIMSKDELEAWVYEDKDNKDYEDDKK